MGTIQNGSAGAAGAAGSGSSPKTISNSARFRKGSSYLDRYPTIAGNSQKFTWSGWIKRGGYMMSKYQRFFASSSATSDDLFRFNTDDTLSVYFDSAVPGCHLNPTAKYRDPSAWYHIILAVDTTQAAAADRVIIYVNGQRITSFATATYPSQNYNVKGFNSTNVHNIGCNEAINTDEAFDGQMAEIHFIDGQQLTPSSFGFFDYNDVWRAKTVSGMTYGNNGFYLPFDNTSTNTGSNAITYSEDFSNAIWQKQRTTITTNTVTGPNGVSTADTITEDTTASNTHRVLYNGMTMTNAVTYTSSIYVKAGSRTAVALEIYNGSTAKYCYANLSTGAVISGSDATATVTSVGNSWLRLTVQHTGAGLTGSGMSLYLMNSATAGAMTYTGNGTGNAYVWGAQIAQTTDSTFMYIPTNGAAVAAGATYLGQDKSLGSSVTYGNNWNAVMSMTPGTSYDASTDVPYPVSSTVGNYCIMSPIDLANQIVSYGGFNTASAGSAGRVRGTIGVSSGKWYFEHTLTSYSLGGQIGVMDIWAPIGSGDLGTISGGWAYFTNNGNKQNNNSSTGYGSSATTNDIIMCALDMDNGKVWWGKNGTWFNSGDPAAGTNAAFTNLSGYTVTPAIGLGSGSSQSWAHNFGQRSYSYTPPTGFNRLNTYNLSTPAVVRPRDYFDCLLWTGTATGSGRSITGLKFSPNLIWSTYRTAAGAGAASKPLVDTVRGTGKVIFSDQTTGDVATNQYGYVSSFDSNGFTTVPGSTGAANNGEYNQLARDFVGWFWKTGTTPGFNIVTYTGDGVNGRAIAHGLGAKPAMWFVKRRDTTSDWYVAHREAGFANYQRLNATDGNVAGGQWFSATPPNSTNFYVGGTGNNVNESGATYIAYLWSEVSGFSKFGIIYGNSSTDGPSLFCGFKPRWIMIKRIDTAGAWRAYDTARNSTNPMGADAYLNTNIAETSNIYFDVNANGFKLRSADTDLNVGTYIFAAFADEPFKYATAYATADRK